MHRGGKQRIGNSIRNYASRLLTSVSGRRFKRESGDKEEKEGKYYFIDDVGVIDIDQSFTFFFLNISLE